jgi:hypothetical protein
MLPSFPHTPPHKEKNKTMALVTYALRENYAKKNSIIQSA